MLPPLPPQLSNRLFEELAMDVYDEVDRRENDAGERGWGWLLGVPPGWVLAAVPAQGGAEPGAPPDPIRTAPQAPPSSFLGPGPGAVSFREGLRCRIGVPGGGGGCRDPPWGWG